VLRTDGVHEDDLVLDLTKPIRIVPDPQSNTLLVSSTEANVSALADVIASSTDCLSPTPPPCRSSRWRTSPPTEFARIVRELFQQGRDIARIAGTSRSGKPDGMVGAALIESVALAVDERTNTVVAAGKEDAVALVEVLTKRLDSGLATGWVEPRLLKLEYADAQDLAETLDAILVEGASNLPQANPLQRQVGRLRMLRAVASSVLESEVFQPMTRLVIRADPQLNALILVGTPVNLDVVGRARRHARRRGLLARRHRAHLSRRARLGHALGEHRHPPLRPAGAVEGHPARGPRHRPGR
jgi:hypothetical protein